MRTLWTSWLFSAATTWGGASMGELSTSSITLTPVYDSPYHDSGKIGDRSGQIVVRIDIGIGIRDLLGS